MPKRVLKPDWRPAVFTVDDTILIQIGLGGIAVIRAADYMSTGDGEYLGVIEKAMPLAVWAFMCLLTGGLLLTGIGLRSHSRVWAGHVVGWMTYTALSVGGVLLAMDGLQTIHSVESMPVPLWISATLIIAFVPALLLAPLQRRLYPDRRPPIRTALAVAMIVGGGAALVGVLPLASIRSVGPLMVIAVTHLIFALRTGARPLPIAAVPTDIQEVTVAPAETA